MYKNKRGTLKFFTALVGVLLSSVMQYYLLTIMKHNTIFEQVVVITLVDLALVLVFDFIKHRLHIRNNEI